jgi:hypothetical protein
MRWYVFLVACTLVLTGLFFAGHLDATKYNTIPSYEPTTGAAVSGTPPVMPL